MTAMPLAANVFDGLPAIDSRIVTPSTTPLTQHPTDGHGYRPPITREIECLSFLIDQLYLPMSLGPS